MDDDEIPLGKCCGCEKEDATVRNVMMIDREAPPMTSGWGCLVCGLEPKGAVAILCDECLEKDVAPRWLVQGVVAHGGRIEATAFPIVPFAHDVSKHPELEEEWRERFEKPL